MVDQKKRIIILAVAIILTIAGVNQSFFSLHDNDRIPRKLSIGNGIESYSTKGSIAAVINTAKMGTDGLHKSFSFSWRKCDRLPMVDNVVPHACKDDRRTFQTHFFDEGSKYIQEHRRNHPEGQCIIATSLRSPATWFGSMFLQTTAAKKRWKQEGELLEEYRKFLANDNFDRIHHVLPDLLQEFNAGTLMQQTKIMDDNGGFSLMSAPPTSVLSGCDLLFLRIENSDRWPDIFQMLDPSLKNSRTPSRAQKSAANISQVDAIASYRLTPEEKRNIYNKGDNFIKDWFDVYGFMDDVYAEESR